MRRIQNITTETQYWIDTWIKDIWEVNIASMWIQWVSDEMWEYWVENHSEKFITVNNPWWWGGWWWDMYKVVYDTNDNWIVDNTENLWWHNASYFLDRSNQTWNINISDVTNLQTSLDGKEDKSNKWTAWWYASLDWTGKVPSTELPSYVDDVLEANDFASLPWTWETGKIYITLDDNKTYRRTWSTYVEVWSWTGEANTISNLWTGEWIAGWKVWVDLRVKSLKAWTNISMSSTADEITINSTSWWHTIQNITVTWTTATVDLSLWDWVIFDLSWATWDVTLTLNNTVAWQEYIFQAAQWSTKYDLYFPTPSIQAGWGWNRAIWYVNTTTYVNCNYDWTQYILAVSDLS